MALSEELLKIPSVQITEHINAVVYKTLHAPRHVADGMYRVHWFGYANIAQASLAIDHENPFEHNKSGALPFAIGVKATLAALVEIGEVQKVLDIVIDPETFM